MYSLRSSSDMPIPVTYAMFLRHLSKVESAAGMDGGVLELGAAVLLVGLSLMSGVYVGRKCLKRRGTNKEAGAAGRTGPERKTMARNATKGICP